jgi:hypothetical protein
MEQVTNFHEPENEPDVLAILVDVRRSMATAKLAELERQSCRLREYVWSNLLSVQKASDLLYDAALSNGLMSTHGDDVIQNVIAIGLGVGASL